MSEQQSLDHQLRAQLNKRSEAGLLRQLRVAENKIDFCSNDYLGFARSEALRDAIHRESQATMVGSTGSRLLTGHSKLAEELEHTIATFHDSPTALLFNSGYDANVGLFTSLGRMVGHVVYDELIHASVHDGMRLSKANTAPFRHNDPKHLDEVLSAINAPALVAVESIYSMDGDACQLQAVVEVCQRHHAFLIVDEAHALGLFGQQGRGLVHQFQLQDKVAARLVTFGKSLGCHGAAVLGSEVLRQYLINYARPLIYSTFTSPHALIAIKCGYDMLSGLNFNALKIREIIGLLQLELKEVQGASLIPSDSAIQCLIVPGAVRCRAVAQQVWDAGFDVRPIVAPTVAAGQERIRICLHEFNTQAEVLALATELREALISNPAI